MEIVSYGFVIITGQESFQSFQESIYYENGWILKVFCYSVIEELIISAKFILITNILQLHPLSVEINLPA